MTAGALSNKPPGKGLATSHLSWVTSLINLRLFETVKCPKLGTTDDFDPNPMEDQKAKPDGEKKPEEKSFWKTFPGVLTGIAAVVTAVATLLAAADKAGLFSSDPTPPSEQKSSDGDGVTTTGDNSPVIQDTGGDVTITVDE